MKKVLDALLLAAAATIGLTQFVLGHWMARFEGGTKLSDVVYNLALNYVASYIFYVLVVYLPENRNKRNIYPYIHIQTEKIVQQSEDVFRELGRQWGHELDIDKIDENDLNRMLACVHLFGDVSPSCYEPGVGLRHLNWLEYLGSAVRESKMAEERILLHPTIVDSGIISRVRTITGSPFFFQVEFLPHLPNNDVNLCFISNEMYQWMRQCSDLRAYAKAEMGQYLDK